MAIDKNNIRTFNIRTFIEFSVQIYIVVGYAMRLFIPKILDIILLMNESHPQM